MTKNSKISKTSKKSENFSENSSETPAVQAKTSKKSPKISKKLLRQIGGKVPSIYTTQRGDLYCTYQKRKIYLGRDPEQARTKLYEMLLRETRSYEPDQVPPAVRRRRPQPIVKVEPEPAPKPSPTICQPVAGLRVMELVLHYLNQFRDKTRFHSVRTALRVVKERYGDIDVEDFGPLALKDCREQFIASNYARRYINDLTGYIVQMFKFGVENELVSESTAARLSYVKPLRRGEARDNPPREEVPDTEILKTLPHLLPTIRDMVILQRISGMRPSELFRMTLEQFVKRDPDGWVYMPFKHKTQIHNKSRVIAFGKYEIAILERHARGKKPDEPLFSPRDAWLERAERLGRKTPQQQPNYNNFYTKDSYNTNIARTIKRVNERMRKEGRPESDLIRHWSPYQLRHATATFLSLLMSRDDAATALGHSTTNTTQIYDHSEVEKALRFVRERDKACGGAIAGLIHQFE